MGSCRPLRLFCRNLDPWRHNCNHIRRLHHNRLTGSATEEALIRRNMLHLLGNEPPDDRSLDNQKSLQVRIRHINSAWRSQGRMHRTSNHNRQMR